MILKGFSRHKNLWCSKAHLFFLRLILNNGDDWHFSWLILRNKLHKTKYFMQIPRDFFWIEISWNYLEINKNSPWLNLWCYTVETWWEKTFPSPLHWAIINQLVPLDTKKKLLDTITSHIHDEDIFYKMNCVRYPPWSIDNFVQHVTVAILKPSNFIPSTT